MAVQCFRRNLKQLIRPGENSSNTISVAEVDYIAERLAETSVFGSDERLGSPWILHDDAKELVNLAQKRATRAQLQRCELIANNLLVLEGIVARVGALEPMSFEQGQLLKKRIQMSGILYNKASHGEFYNASERVVLFQMSQHVFDWVRYLSFLPGNDLMDLLSTSRLHPLDFQS